MCAGEVVRGYHGDGLVLAVETLQRVESDGFTRIRWRCAQWRM